MAVAIAFTLVFGLAVMCSPIFIFGIIALTETLLGQDKLMVHEMKTVQAPGGGTSAVVRSMHWEPYFISPPILTDIWLSRPSTVAHPTIVFEVSGEKGVTATWRGPHELVIELLGTTIPRMSIRKLEDVSIIFRVNRTYLAPDYLSRMEKVFGDSPANLKGWRQGYDKFCAWALENAENARE